MKYLKKAKTTEALLNIRKMYDGEIAYYQIDHIDSGGNANPTQFVAAGPTPSTVPEAQSFWEIGIPRWSALKFAADGPVYYRYSIISSGTGIESVFSAQAEGDLTETVQLRCSREVSILTMSTEQSGFRRRIHRK